jgi:hypothetical protein
MRLCSTRIAVVTLVASVCLIRLAAGEGNALPIRFESQILPILQKKCLRCHGAQKRNAELNLATGADLLHGSESGAVVVAGQPDESLLYQKIRDREMPPEGNEPLTDAEAELIRRWIAEGAKLADSSRVPVAITQHQIIPLMRLRCTACHGGRRREAELDLRTKASMLRGGKSGPAVVAGKPDESLIIRRIKAEEMPPRRQLVSVSVKPMEAAELQKLESWIASGMPESPIGPDVATNEPDQLVTADDRAFWSFHAPAKTAAPLSVLATELPIIRNPMDAFVLAKLREQGLSFSPEADRVTLIRRLSFDLIGLPPTPEEVAAFVDDPSPQAYEALVDRLLASPHYGERWGRHWLDVAGYADSEGAQNEDRVRPNMWRYRDYVVRAHNADKPYDRFLQEQIAGDELADYEHAPVITDEIYDNLVATGFLRTAPDRTFANITNFVPDRLEVIADEIQVLGSSVFGLTLHCCRCHSHKFDPLPQRDYFRLAAILKDALDEHDWLGPEVRQLKYVLPAERQTWEQAEKAIDAKVAPLKEQLDQAKTEKEKSDDSATKKLQEQIKKIEADRKPEPTIRALWSRGDPSPTYVLQRGNYLTPGSEVGPGVPSVLTDGKSPLRVEPPWPNAQATGRRLALARWLTAPDHPLTARVAVNRMWKHHFGTGIVSTPGNFGKTGAAPTHPELLDWLANEFVRCGWSMKAMHRLMVTSTTYRQSSERTAAAASSDPQNRLLSHMPLRRLEAEIVRDSLLFVAGQLNDRPYGPPDEVDVRGDGLVTAKSTSLGSRRSIFVLHRRTKLPTILENFDSPQMGPNCVERGESIVAPQALHLLNNATIYEWAERFADRVREEVGSEPDLQIARANQLALGRSPSAEELRIARVILEKLTEDWLATLGSQPDAKQLAAKHALRNYCHAVMNSAAFVYVD